MFEMRRTALKKDTIFLSIFLVLLALHVLLVASLRLYPFIDMPLHLAQSTILKYYGDAANQFDRYYSVNLSCRPNVFHSVFCSLGIFPSVEFGNTIFLALYVILLPLSVLLVIERIGGNRWFSLLSFLFLYNFNTMWGFAGILFSIPVFFIAFYFIMDYIDNANIRAGIVVALLFLSLFFMHVLTVLFSIPLFFLYALIRCGRPDKKILFMSIVVIPVIIMVAVWLYSKKGTLETNGLFDYYRLFPKPKVPGMAWYYDFYGYSYFRGLPLRIIRLITLDCRSLLTGNPWDDVFRLFSLPALIPVIGWIIVHRRTLRLDIREKKIRSIGIFFLWALFCYLVLPYGVPSIVFIFQRFSVFVLLSAVLLSSVLYPGHMRNTGKILICSICVLHLFLWLEFFVQFNRENRSFTKEIFPENRDSVLAGLVYDYRFRNLNAYIHFPYYYIVWNRGIACGGFIDVPGGGAGCIVSRKADFASLPPYNEWIGKYNTYDGEYSDVDYILVRGEPTGKDTQHLEHFNPVRKVDAWTLLKNTRSE